MSEQNPRPLTELEQRIVDWCATRYGTARDIRRAFNLMSMSVQAVTEMLERLVTEGRIKGTTTTDRFCRFGQYSSLYRTEWNVNQIGDTGTASTAGAPPSTIEVRLTKLQAAEVGDALGIRVGDTETLAENLQSYQAERGLNDESFDKWIEKHYINAAWLEGTTLVLDTSKEAWRQIATDIVLDLDDRAGIHGENATTFSSKHDRKQYDFLRNAARSCAKARDAIDKALGLDTKLGAAGSASPASASLQKGGDAMREANTPSKSQLVTKTSQVHLTQNTGEVMSTTPVTPTPPGDGGKKSTKKPVNTDAHVKLVIQQAGAKLTRKLTADEAAAVHAFALTVGHPITTEEALTVIEMKSENNELQAHTLEFHKSVATQKLAEWSKKAVDLDKNLGGKIGTFKAMHDEVQSVNESFTLLNDAITDGLLPPEARIMPETEWQKTLKDGKTKVTEKGFLYFSDYCRVVLKRTKQAVYAMLSDANPPAEPKEQDHSEGTMIKRGASSFLNLYRKITPPDPTLTLEDFANSILAAARKKLSDELRQHKQKAEVEAYELFRSMTFEQRQKMIHDLEVLPPPAGHAG